MDKLVCAGINSDPLRKARRVSVRLEATISHADSAGDALWSNSIKGYALALLQDRVAQVGGFIESC